jgi:hypothetical protein
MPIVLSTRLRLALLLSTFGLGLGVALVGYRITGQEAWFLAIPSAIAAVWLLVADPRRCACLTSEGNAHDPAGTPEASRET